MKILDLVLKGQWYDMIELGEKKEEYREMKPYWCARLMPPDYLCEKRYTIPPTNSMYLCGVCGTLCRKKDGNHHQIYTHIRFHRGYTSKTMIFALEGLTIGEGNPEWGAPIGKQVFILKLGGREA